MSVRAWIALTAMAFAATAWTELDAVHHPLPGVAAPEEPQQDPVEHGPNQWRVGERMSAFALATYIIHGRVLQVKHYGYDACSKIAPVDLALGWGRMSDWGVYHRLSISQRGRYYLFSWGPEGPPIPKREIETHSSNNHIIPANETVARDLRGVQANDLVWLQGDLVEVNGPNGFTWRSSLTREDTGGGSCELIRVTNLVIEPSDRQWVF
jgi:hypothetical protein